MGWGGGLCFQPSDVLYPAGYLLVAQGGCKQAEKSTRVLVCACTSVLACLCDACVCVRVFTPLAPTLELPLCCGVRAWCAGQRRASMSSSIMLVSAETMPAFSVATRRAGALRPTLHRGTTPCRRLNCVPHTAVGRCVCTRRACLRVAYMVHTTCMQRLQPCTHCHKSPLAPHAGSSSLAGLRWCPPTFWATAWPRAWLSKTCAGVVSGGTLSTWSA